MSTLLFTLKFYHHYYRDGVIPDAELIPEASTSKMMSRLKLGLVKSGGSYRLYYFGSNTTSAFLAYLCDLLDGSALTFYLAGCDSNFVNISDVPLDWCGAIAYSNAVKKQIPEVDQLMGSKDGYLLMPDFSESKKINCSAGSVLSEVVINPVLLGKDMEINTSPEYSVSINARQTRWYYYVINRSQVKLFQPQITDLSGESFEPAEEVLAVNGEKALLFSSGTKTFPLHEVALKKFNLVDFVDPKRHQPNKINIKRSKTLIDDLPVPTADVINIKVEGSQRYAYSEMYVYL